MAYTNAIAGTLNLLPPAAAASMLKHVDFVASNVPGFTAAVYLAGARVERYVAFGPTIGAALNVTLLSDRGRCYAGVTVDTAAVPDPDVLVECLREGFNEVLALGAAHQPAPASRPASPPRARGPSRRARDGSTSAGAAVARRRQMRPGDNRTSGQDTP